VPLVREREKVDQPIKLRSGREASVVSRLSFKLPTGRRAVWAVAVRQCIFGVVPLFLTGYLIALFYPAPHLFASDFQRSYWPAASQILQGHSPYIEPRMLTRDAGFIYPAVGALLFAPVALIPKVLGGMIFTLLNIGAGLLTLRVLNVRDWRLYGLIFLWLPVISAWETANVTLLVGLGIALLWRYRRRPAVAGGLAAVLISVKPFVWPLGIWLLATRRYKAAAYAAAYGLVLNLLAWGILGFNEIPRYKRLAQAFTKDGERIGYSVVSLALHVGITRAAAYAGALTLAALAAGACVVLGRRGSELSALVLSLAVTLLATPFIWLHYFALLIVPLALTRPRLGYAWALPLATWVCLPTDNPTTWKIAVAVAACTSVFVVASRKPNQAPGEHHESGGETSGAWQPRLAVSAASHSA
jgi:hypothetical protein